MPKKTKHKLAASREKASQGTRSGRPKRGGVGAKSGVTGTLSICLLSPHPFVLENLRRMLERPKFSVHSERVEYLPGQGGGLPALPGADVFVLDANGPLRAVVALISRVKGEQPKSRVVVVSDELTEEAAFPLIRLGIRGLLRYSDAPTQLAAAVMSVNGGGYWVPRLLLSRFVFGILDQSRLPVPGETRKLSPREQQVHEALLENLSNKEIAARLNLSERTVKFHVSNVLAKHRLRRRADLILQNYHARPFDAGGGKPTGG